MSHTDKLQLQFHNSVQIFVLPDQFVTMKIISLYSKFVSARTKNILINQGKITIASYLPLLIIQGK